MNTLNSDYKDGVKNDNDEDIISPASGGFLRSAMRNFIRKIGSSPLGAFPVKVNAKAVASSAERLVIYV
jgi:hypothetical protein